MTTSHLPPLAAVLLDPERSPLEHRDAAIGVVAVCEASAPRGSAGGVPPVDVWRLMAWARGLSTALDRHRGPVRLLCVDASVPALVVALLGRDDVQVTLLHSVPKAGKRARATLRELLGIEAELIVADPAAWSAPDRSWDIGVTFAVEPALRGCTSPATTARLSTHCGLWLPRSIEVHAVLIDHDTGVRIDIGPAAVVGAEGLRTACVELPPVDDWGDEVVLQTSITVHEPHRLERLQSGLTNDRPLPPGPRAPLPGARLSFAWNERDRTLNFV